MRPHSRRLGGTLSAVLLLPTLAGCATIINGRSQDVSLASTPPGVTVKVEDTHAITPARMTLKRDADHRAVFSQEGLPERAVTLEKKPSWWLLGNLVFGGLIGLVIDLVSGGGFTLVPDSVDMDMATGVVKSVEASSAPGR